MCYPVEEIPKRNRLATMLTVLVLAVGFAVMALCSGCRTSTPNGDTQNHIASAGQDIQQASEPLIRAELRRETIVQNVQRATDAAKDQPKVTEPLIVAKAQGVAMAEDHGAIKSRLAEVESQLAKAKTSADENDAKLTHLNGQWYVKVGIWIERAIGTLIALYLIANLIGFVGGLGNPGGWIAWFAKQLRLFLPGMNGASWALAAVQKVKAM